MLYFFNYNENNCKSEPGMSYHPRKFDEEKDFRLLSSALSQSQETGVGNSCNQSQMQWLISSFPNKMFKFRLGFQGSCSSSKKVTCTTNSGFARLQETLFNLIYPAHNFLYISMT